MERGVATGDGRLSLSDGGPLDPKLLPPFSDSSLLSLLEVASESRYGCVFVDAFGSVRRWSYDDLAKQAARLASALRARGLGAGSFALLQIPDNAEFLTAVWGCLAAGVVPVPIAPAKHARDTERLRAIGAALPNAFVLDTPSGAQRWRDSADQKHAVFDISALGDEAPVAARGLRFEGSPEADDVALLLPTSGSSGTPKLVALTHREIIRRTVSCTRASGLGREHVSLNWMPLDHVGGLVMFHIRDVYLGSQQVHVATQYVALAPLRWLDLIQEHAVRVTWAPNFAFRAVVDALAEVPEQRWDLSSVTHWINAGEMIVGSTVRQFCQRLVPSGLDPRTIRPVWGMSETSSGVTENVEFDALDPASVARPVSVGRPIPGVAVRIVGASGSLLPEGREGRLEVKGAGLMQAYWGDPVRTRAVFTEDGWLRTGDLGIISGGALTICAREDDTITINGLKFHPTEIEAVVQDAEAARVAQIVACSTRSTGVDTDQLAVFFVPRVLGADAAPAIAAHIREQVISKIGLRPAHMIQLRNDELPRTDSGKVQRSQLRRRLESGVYDQRRIAEANAGPARPLFERIWVSAALERAGVALAREVDGGAGFVLIGPVDDFVHATAQALARAGARVRCADETQSAGDAPDEILVYLVPPAEMAISDSRGVGAWTKTFLPALAKLATAARTADGARTVALLTCGAQRVVPADRADWGSIGAAGLWGTARVLQNENPHVRVRLIDVASASDPDAVAAALLDATRAEDRASGSPIEDEVAYRAGERYVARLAAIPSAIAAPPRSLSGKSVLISGGLGALGLLMAEHFARRHVAKVVLLGRAAPARETVTRLERCSAETTVPIEVHRADVNDLSQVQRAVNAALRGSEPLGLVLHAAGTFGDVPVAQLTEARALEVIAARVSGAMNLHWAASKLGYERFVVLSSIVGILGYPGLASYAAACEMQEALISRLRQDGFPITVASWPAWSDAGRAVGETVRHNEHMGVHSISAHAALPLLDEIIAGDRVQHLVLSLAVDQWTRFCPASRYKGLLRELPNPAPRAESRRPASLSSQVERGAVFHECEAVENCLARHLADVLGIASGGLDRTARFDELGLSSMAALLFRDAVERELKLSLTPAFTWRYPTLRALAAWLVQSSRARAE